MSLTELLPNIRSLPRDEQVRLVHFLIEDLARPGVLDESLMNQPPGALEVFSPEPCPEAADALLKLLTDPKSMT